MSAAPFPRVPAQRSSFCVPGQLTRERSSGVHEQRNAEQDQAEREGESEIAFAGLQDPQKG